MSNLIEKTIPDQPFFSRAEVAQLLGVAEQTLAKWGCNREGPCFVKVGPRTVRYPRKALVEWLSRQGGGGHA